MPARSSRRRFLGLAALQLSAAAGLTIVAPARAGAARSGDAWTDALARGAGDVAAREFWPAIVIGSGYGGAVSARRLAEAGTDVLMLEMGQLWNAPGRNGKVFCDTTAPDGRAMWFKRRTEAPLASFFGLDVVNRPIAKHAGVLDRVHFEGMSVYLGRGVGGGSLVNGGMAVTPRRAYFEEILPQVDAAAMYSTYLPRAQAALGVNTVAPAFLKTARCLRYARVGMAQARRVGFRTVTIPSVYDLAYLEREQAGEVPRSALAQEVIYGNNHGKLSVDKTYIASALGTGRLSVQTLTRVAGIRREPDGTYVLSTVQIDVHGGVVGRREIGCAQLVLGAGSLGTSELLLRARDTGALPDLPEAVGQGWGNNGNVMAARWAGYGANTGAQQSTMPVVAIDNWDDPAGPALVEITPLPTGFENFTASYLGVTKTPERATFAYDRASDGITLDWKRGQTGTSVRALKRMTDRLNRAYGTPYRTDLFGGGRAFADDFSYHPLGGALLGRVTDAYGRVKGHEGLYVNDGSLIPGSVGVNPLLTITALAERNIEAIIARA